MTVTNEMIRAANNKMRELCGEVMSDDICRAVLAETIAAYGNPGGPWNVPSDPGGWLSRAQEAFAAYRAALSRGEG